MKKLRFLIIILILSLLLLGCSNQQAATAETAPPVQSETPQPSSTPKPTEPPRIEVMSIEAVADDSLEAADIDDPYSDLNRYIAAIYKPDRELYNFLYRKIDAKSKGADLSGFDLTFKEKYATAGCLFAEANYRFFYLKNFKLRNDGSTIKFVYRDIDEADIAKGKETLAAELSHIKNNVAPEGYSQLQRFMAVYQYICDISDYTADISDDTTHSPYSILTGGQGICAGYAQLMDYVLGCAGIESEYVASEAHAWNIVRLNEKWYHTDVTWGAGNSADTRNNLYHILMDDETRLKSLESQGYPADKIIVGYPGGDEAAPPACTDQSFNDYNSLGFCQALDIENSKVYFCDMDGIGRMNLDCSERETLVQGGSCSQMLFFSGALYYISTSDGHIYSLVAGEEPELLDGSDMFCDLSLDGGQLIYGKDDFGKDSRSLSLLTLPGETSGALIMHEASIPRSRSFCIRIKFSESMDKAQNWNECVYLADDKGNALPLHFDYDSSVNTLTVRPKSCAADFGHVTVYVTTDAAGLNGGRPHCCLGMRVNIVSAASTQ